MHGIRVHVIRNDAGCPPGRLGDVLTARLGDAWDIVALDRGEPAPDLDDGAALVLLGGHMGAYDEEEYPYLAVEKDLVRCAVDRSVPVLGICLGCQILADALGGSAYRAPGLEARFGPCELSGAGAADPVVRHLGHPVLDLHQDTWSAPPGSRVLATTARYPQAFRLGSALGIQPHPEVTPDAATEWFESVGHERIIATGVDPEELAGAIAAGADRSAATAADLFGAWLDEAVGPSAPT